MRVATNSYRLARDPAAYRARHQRDWVPVEGQAPTSEGPAAQPRDKDSQGGEGRQQGEGARRRRHRGGRGPHDRPERSPQQPSEAQNKSTTAPPQATMGPVAGSAEPVSAASVGSVGFVPSTVPMADAVPVQDTQDEALRTGAAGLAGADLANLDTLSLPRQPLPPPEPLFPQPVVRPPAADEDDTPVIPGRRQKLTAMMEAELDRAMGGLSLDDLMRGEGSGPGAVLEPESRHTGRVVAIRRDEVFVEIRRPRARLPARRDSFETLPQPGESIEVIVQRFNAEEGLYDLTLPGASVDSGNWDEVHEGMLVDAQVTGHNAGGLECEVNHIRGFIPVSQISLYRVEDLAQFVGQKFTCLITEANAARKNLVLSRRAVLEREQEERKTDLLRVACARPGLRRHGPQADGLRGLCRAGQRRRRLAARQPVVVGPHQASQRGRAGRPAGPRPHREDRPRERAASAFPIAR